MLQNIEIIGNLVADAELKTGKDGREYVAFRVAVSDNGGEEKRTTYYDVTFMKSGLQAYLKKGKYVYVSGRFSVSAVCKEDKAYLNAYVSARDIVLLRGGSSEG